MFGKTEVCWQLPESTDDKYALSRKVAQELGLLETFDNSLAGFSGLMAPSQR
jgi:hypothetical protein